MTDITGIYTLRPDACPHEGFGIQAHLFDDDLTCEGCGTAIEIEDGLPSSHDHINSHLNTNKEIN